MNKRLKKRFLIILILFTFSTLIPVQANSEVDVGDKFFYKSTEELTLSYDGEITRERAEYEYVLEVMYVENYSIGCKKLSSGSIMHSEEEILNAESLFLDFQHFHFVKLDEIQTVYDAWNEQLENHSKVESYSAQDRTFFVKFINENYPIIFYYNGSDFTQNMDYGNGSLIIQASYNEESVLTEYTLTNVVIGEYVQQNWTEEIILLNTIHEADLSIIPVVMSLMIFTTIFIILRRRRSNK